MKRAKSKERSKNSRNGCESTLITHEPYSEMTVNRTSLVTSCQPQRIFCESDVVKCDPIKSVDGSTNSNQSCLPVIHKHKFRKMKCQSVYIVITGRCNDQMYVLSTVNNSSTGHVK